MQYPRHYVNQVRPSKDTNVVRFLYRAAIYSSTGIKGNDARLSTATRGRRISPGKQLVMTEMESQKPATYLVAWYRPASLGNELGRLLVDIWASNCNLVLRRVSVLVMYPNLVILRLHTTVRSSNGLASSMFFSVFSKSFSSKSTRPFVSSAFFTACASKASMALICLPTSYVAGLNELKCFSISSTTAWFFRIDR